MLNILLFSCSYSISIEHVTDTYRIKFDIDLSNKKHVTNAEFRFFKAKRQGFKHEDIHHPNDRVEVYSITRPNNYYGAELRQFITALFITPDKDGYAVFNVSEVFDSWIYHNPNRIGELELEVWIRCPEALKSGVMFTPNIQFIADNTTAQLVLTSFSEEDSDQVEKRAIRFRPGFCEENPNAFQCCLRPLEINFQRDFNWTWVIEPRSISINYCKGSCPHNWNFYNRHSDLITLLRLNNPAAAPEPCCVANRFERKVVLVHIEGEDVLHNLDDVAVKSCVCR